MNATSGPGNGLDLLLLFGDVGLPTVETVLSANDGSSFAAVLANVECCNTEAHSANETAENDVELTEAQPQLLNLDELLRERFADFAPPAWNLNVEQTVVTDADADSSNLTESKLHVESPDTPTSQAIVETIDVEIDASESIPIPSPPAQRPQKTDPTQKLELADEPTLKLLELPPPPSVSVKQPWGRQLAETIAAALKTTVVARVTLNQPAALSGEASKPASHISRHEAHFSLPFHEGVEFTDDEQPSDAPAIQLDSRDEATRELNKLADELPAEVHHVQSSQDEVVIELQLPELGALAIEVSRDAQETEVSLHADPTLHLLIRDHLQEFVAALSESGIEFAGLDVRQQGHQQQSPSHPDTLPLESIESTTGRMSSATQAPAKTGLARYQLMSVTA